MSDYVSDVKMVNAKDEVIFNKLSDFKNLESYRDMIPENGAVKDLKSDVDWVSVNVSPVGDIVMRIVEREPYKTIKIEAEKSPVPLTGWIQLVKVDESHTKMRLTLRADIPFMLKAMLGSKVQEGVNKAAEVLAGLSY